MKGQRAIRLSILAALCLMLGAAASIAVAVACAAWSPVRWCPVVGPALKEPWPTAVGRRWPSPVQVSYARGWGITGVAARSAEFLGHVDFAPGTRVRREWFLTDPDSEQFAAQRMCFGWPIAVLETESRAWTGPGASMPDVGHPWQQNFQVAPLPWYKAGLPTGGGLTWAGVFPGRTIPTGPLPGLAASAAVYGATGWLATRAVGWQRRAARRSRRLCLWCGYPAEAATTCPECGHSPATSS